MKLNRRGFLGALATAAVGACVAAKIPATVLPVTIRRRASESARQFLTARWIEHARGKGIAHTPRAVLVGRSLYESYEGELAAFECFVDDANYMTLPRSAFKGCTVYASDRLTGLSGWDYVFLSKDEWQRALDTLSAGTALEWARNTNIAA